MKSVLETAIGYAIPAPSSHNSQPWKFRLENNSVFIYPDYGRSLPVTDGDHHELFISLGCALENLVIAINHFGYKEEVEYHFNENEDYIKVNLSGTVTAGGKELFDAIVNSFDK